MAKINDTTTFPNTIPALTDFVIGTDVSDTGNSVDGEVVTFRFTDIFDIIPLPTHYVNTFSTNLYNTGNQIYSLDNFDALIVDFHFSITAPSDTTNVDFTAELSSDNGTSYGTAKTLFGVSVGADQTKSGTSRLYVTLGTGVYRGYQSLQSSALSGTIAGGGSSVTNLRLGISVTSSASPSARIIVGAATGIGAVKLPSEL